MDINHLKYFVEVAHHKSFTKASRTLHVSQPSLSKSVRLLEDEWQQPLFHRRGHNIELTDKGAAILPQIELLVHQFEDLERQMGKFQDCESGPLTLGIPPMIGTSFLSPVLREFISKFPNISLKVSENGSKFIAQQVENGLLHVGFVALPVNLGSGTTIQTHVFHHQPLQLIVPKNSSFSGKKVVSIEELRNVPLVYFQETFSLYEVVRSCFQQAGIQPRIVAQSNNWDFLSEMVKNGLGVAMLPQCICSRLNEDEVDIIPLRPTINWVLAMIWNERNMMYPPVRLWVNYCREKIPSIWNENAKDMQK